jgi:hypothetical protein
MALTKVNRGGLNTGISDSSNATFLTVDTSEQAVIKSEGGAVTTSVQQGLGKCWINAKIVSTYSTRDSFNCSVTTDHGAGEVTYTYTNNFSNNDYVISHMSKQASSQVGGVGFPSGGTISDADDASNGMTTSTCRWQYRNNDSAPALRDQEIAGHIWMGDLA